MGVRHLRIPLAAIRVYGSMACDGLTCAACMPMGTAISSAKAYCISSVLPYPLCHYKSHLNRIMSLPAGSPDTVRIDNEGGRVLRTGMTFVLLGFTSLQASSRFDSGSAAFSWGYSRLTPFGGCGGWPSSGKFIPVWCWLCQGRSTQDSLIPESRRILERLCSVCRLPEF